MGLSKNKSRIKQNETYVEYGVGNTLFNDKKSYNGGTGVLYQDTLVGTILLNNPGSYRFYMSFNSQSISQRIKFKINNNVVLPLTVIPTTGMTLTKEIIVPAPNSILEIYVTPYETLSTSITFALLQITTKGSVEV